MSGRSQYVHGSLWFCLWYCRVVKESSLILCKGANLKRLRAHVVENGSLFVMRHSVDGFVVVSVEAHGRLIKCLSNLPVLTTATIHNRPLVLLLQIRVVLSSSFVQEILSWIFVQNLLLTVVHHGIWWDFQLSCRRNNRFQKLNRIVLIISFTNMFVNWLHVASIVTIKRKIILCVVLGNCLQLF